MLQPRKATVSRPVSVHATAGSVKAALGKVDPNNAFVYDKLSRDVYSVYRLLALLKPLARVNSR
jgi:hypothetical protein